MIQHKLDPPVIGKLITKADARHRIFFDFLIIIKIIKTGHGTDRKGPFS